MFATDTTKTILSGFAATLVSTVFLLAAAGPVKAEISPRPASPAAIECPASPAAL